MALQKALSLIGLSKVCLFTKSPKHPFCYPFPQAPHLRCPLLSLVPFLFHTTCERKILQAFLFCTGTFGCLFLISNYTFIFHFPSIILWLFVQSRIFSEFFWRTIFLLPAVSSSSVKRLSSIRNHIRGIIWCNGSAILSLFLEKMFLFLCGLGMNL